eukprot:m.306284 g.306284  ORF g.306284 m.306284 type:complete len:99 (+) comp41111_c0_seq1:162-458(+)
MVWNYIINFARTRFPILMLPLSIVIGAAGYTIESKYRKQRVVTHPKSIQEERDERLLKELTGEVGDSNSSNQGPGILEWQPGRGLTEKERLRRKKVDE